jgi:hypothetical protein
MLGMKGLPVKRGKTFRHATFKAVAISTTYPATRVIHGSLHFKNMRETEQQPWIV